MSATAAHTLPWDWYADPSVLRLESERIFRRAWQYVARVDQLAERGSFVATSVGATPVLLVRDADEVLRAFHNVCRHRGSLVCEGEGRRETLQCPYHAWTYGLDGTLRNAPRANREPGFDPTGLDLVPVSVETWGPLVFANPEPAAPPLAEWLESVPERLAEAGLVVEQLRFHGRSESELEANWKIVCENFLECYHCQVAHPGFSKVVDVAPDAYRLEVNGSRASQLGPVRERWQGSFDPTGEIAGGQFHFLFPSTAINVMPGRPNLSIGPILPAGSERTHRFLDYFVAVDADEDWIAGLLDFDGRVGAEDKVLVERVQQGVRSAVLPHGYLLPESERLVAWFRDRVVAALAQEPSPLT
jgi:choline monooxygenase